MSSSKPTAILDFLYDKEDCKVSEDNLRSTMFSNMNCSQKSFKEELFSDDLSINWKAENDFNVEDLLGSYFENELHTSGAVSALEAEEGVGPQPSSEGLVLKEEDYEPFKDFVVSLPFEAVMDSLDQPGFEVGSDSGISTDNIPDVMLSPSSGVMSPDDHMGDISIDTLDAASDVSSTSDLGSMGSFGSTGSSPNGGNGYAFTPSHVDGGGVSGMVSPPCYADEEDVEMKSLPISLDSVSDKSSIFVTASPFSQRCVVASSPHSITKLSPSSTVTATISPQPTILTPQLQLQQPQPSIATRSIRLATHHSPRIVKTISTANTTVSNTTSRSPVLTKVRLDPSGAITSPKIVTSRTNSPQTIVVTQAGKRNPLLRNGTLLKAGTGRSILFPVNVNDLNQVRTIKIISAGSTNGTSPRTGLTAAGLRTLVSAVRPSPASGPAGTTTSAAAPTRTTFYTTSKGSDGRSLLKVTPTAFVAPTAHTVNQVSSAQMASRLVKEEQSDEDEDDEDTPLPNQELLLTEEERRLMRKEGLVLPSRYPLTKQEERDLKRIRRKIRNKISAQDSRKRKKEYVDGLEDRVKNCTDENQQLQKRIKSLEKQNETLIAQLKKVQGLVGGGLYQHRPHNHTSTALMMLILSAALFVVPSLRSQDGKGENELTRNSKMPSAGHSRTLLEARNSALSMEGFPTTSDEEEIDPLTFSHALSDHDYAPVAKKIRMDTPSTFFSPPSVDKTLSRESGDPPDSIGGLAAMIGAMFDRLGSNWTDPGGHIGAMNRTPPHHSTPGRSSVVVNLNHGRRMRDDIELE